MIEPLLCITQYACLAKRSPSENTSIDSFKYCGSRPVALYIIANSVTCRFGWASYEFVPDRKVAPLCGALEELDGGRLKMRGKWRSGMHSAACPQDKTSLPRRALRSRREDVCPVTSDIPRTMLPEGEQFMSPGRNPGKRNARGKTRAP